MTPDELDLLKAIRGKNVETFLPAGRSAAQAKAFDELVERLQALKRLGWIELEVAGHRAVLESISGPTSPPSHAGRMGGAERCRLGSEVAGCPRDVSRATTGAG